MPKDTFLLDVNVLLALLSMNHSYHQIAKDWFYRTPRLKWAICAFTEAGYLRIASRPGQHTVAQATESLASFKKHPGYHYIPIRSDWDTLCSRFFKRLYGTKQVTDAYLLGLAIEENLILVTLDRGIMHLAGDEFEKHVLLLQAK
ncbi:TA system VapC family ribonuclease toxin [Terracidiphilus gabretensis]|uniref:TA system VapC family ribonuclease toxin n=1 Tax=Terracidiphilus gabretensis TaxID=1577687 RepID=UPI00071B416C|nr:TA system VapC family ribonuclease toxin [Terracidiphilus gabretensis]